MSDNESKKSRINIWLLVGVLILIVLLFLWLTMADFFGDTDVAAFIHNSWTLN